MLAPIAALALKALRLSWTELWELATNERALASYQLSLGASLAAALINALFGSLLAWVLVRYPFPGRRLLDGLIDFPFALPTAVAGLTLANLFSDHGWLGQWLVPLGIHGAYYAPGRRHRPHFRRTALLGANPSAGHRERWTRRCEEAAACLGAGRWRTFVRVVAPTLLPRC